ncbi:Imm26 family immunity protein [Hymenobacter psychrotolerans]|uniref:Imm26 family immunity protein n=1 Tax=Hymenobacter psychrotolerans TaxID=344998 RepID=UPI0009356019|nr:Imm26 family immunity protein [Hymenobacter psychrotolerans]
MGSPQISVGAVIEIDLRNGYYAYGKILAGADYGIYDSYTTQRIQSVKEVIGKPFIFIVAVNNYAINGRRWLKIGKDTSTATEQNHPLKFIQDPLKLERFELYDPVMGTIKPASKQDCAGLERCSVWAPEHVEERIVDYYAGRPNKYRQMDLDILK